MEIINLNKKILNKIGSQTKNKVNKNKIRLKSKITTNQINRTTSTILMKNKIMINARTKFIHKHQNQHFKPLSLANIHKLNQINKWSRYQKY